MMRIVFGAEIVGGELELRPIPSPSVSESFRLHLFGNFTLFLGHYVMELRRDDVYLARPYSLAGVPGAFEIFTFSAGSFVVQGFQGWPEKQMSIPSAAAAEKLWLSRDLSSLRYLLVLNGRAMRSFSDLSAYPVLPRVVKRVERLTLRDLSYPSTPRRIRILSTRCSSVATR